MAAGDPRPVDLAEPDHRALLLMLGHQSEREVLRNRFRTTAAMAVQIREQGQAVQSRAGTGVEPRSDWVISAELTHPPLVGDEEFLAVQQITALAQPVDGRARRYTFTGLLVCRVCGRRLDGHWVNRRPAYRCRHGRTSAHPADVDAPRWVYWSQAHLVRELVATDPGFAGLDDAEKLASHLRARDAVIVCGPDRLTVEDAIIEETAVGSAVVEAAHVQLELPIPAGASRRRGRKNPQNLSGRIPSQRRRNHAPTSAARET